MLFCGMLAAPAFAQQLPAGCGTLRTGFGPFDYRAERYIPETSYGSQKALLYIVEHAHFTPEVEAGIRGKSTSRAADDISYTLHVFPNHHRALIAISNISVRQNSDVPGGSTYSVECWFQRAIGFRPDDVLVRLIYAGHLIKTKRLKDAEFQAEFVVANARDNAFTHLNVGLVYFDMQNFDLARKHAHIAVSLGLNSPTLKNLLIGVGKWVEPVESNADGGPINRP